MDLNAVLAFISSTTTPSTGSGTGSADLLSGSATPTTQG